MSNDNLTPFEEQLREQILRNWKNYRKHRIDLGIARTKEKYNMAGKYISVAKVSSGAAEATIALNEKENDDLDLEKGLEIETFFKSFFITNTAQSGEWIELIIGADFSYKKKAGLELFVRADNDYDFTKNDLSLDGNWHDLDLSPFIPKNTKFAILRTETLCMEAAVQSRFRRKGDTWQASSRLTTTGNAAVQMGYCIFVFPDANGKIEYRINAGTWFLYKITVAFWFV